MPGAQPRLHSIRVVTILLLRGRFVGSFKDLYSAYQLSERVALGNTIFGGHANAYGMPGAQRCFHYCTHSTCALCRVFQGPALYL